MSGPPKFKMYIEIASHVQWGCILVQSNNNFIGSFMIKLTISEQKKFSIYLFLQNQELKRLTLSLEFSTAATCGGILTIKWGFWLQRGNHTLAGRFRFNVVNSATSLVVFASFVGMELSNLPISISACINSSSGLSLGAWK